jgi:hypothetical protein
MTEQQTMSMRDKKKMIDTIYWGTALVWAGLMFGAESLGILPQVGEADAWSWAFAGVGLFGLLGSMYRSIAPNLPDAVAWDFIWSAGLLILGLSGFTSLDIGFPLILLLAGLVLLGGAILRRE